MVAAVCKLGLEGIVCKRLDAPLGAVVELAQGEEPAGPGGDAS